MNKFKQYTEELTIDALASEGVAIARKDNLVYFVKNAVPGDKVLALIKKKKRRYFEAETVQVLEPSIHRTSPKCQHFGYCGGCSWQNLEYSEQLKWKKQNTIDALVRMGKLEIADIFDVYPSKFVFGYRNKMEFSFCSQRWLTPEEISNVPEIEDKHFALGLHVPGRYDKVLDVFECHIQAPEANLLLHQIRTKAVELGLSCNDHRTHSGFLRNLVIRKSFSENKLMAILITRSPSNEAEKAMVEFLPKLIELVPNLASIIHSVNNTFSPVAQGEIRQITGDDHLIEVIHNIKFKISPFSFFQTNSSQLNSFISNIIEFAGIESNHIVWDFYCGTGSITLPAVLKAGKVFGFELSESSISNATENAKFNDIKNAKFLACDLHKKSIQYELNLYPNPDIIIIDPPRAGMHGILIDVIISKLPKRIVYVSCNPATQARDIGLLKEFYSVTKVQPYDMFPHTYHIETIALLERKNTEQSES